MKDKQHEELIEKFANEHSIAKGGGMRVSFTHHATSFIPKDTPSQMKYEDVCFLADMIKGADHFLFWLRRSGYTVTRGKKCAEKA